MIQIVSAVEYLHSRRIIHRDIKPENILLDMNFDTKLCDFGFCAPFGDGILRKTLCGTQEYIPPEILSKDTQDNKVDIWCLGVLLYEMVHRKTPFQGLQMRNMRELQKKIKIQFKDGINSKFKKIIKMCLQFEPHLRPDASEILEILKDNRKYNKKKQRQNVQVKNNININIANLNINFGFQKKQHEEKHEISEENNKAQLVQKVIKYSVTSQNSNIQHNNRVRKITYSVPKKSLEEHLNLSLTSYIQKPKNNQYSVSSNSLNNQTYHNVRNIYQQNYGLQQSQNIQQKQQFQNQNNCSKRRYNSNQPMRQNQNHYQQITRYMNQQSETIKQIKYFNSQRNMLVFDSFDQGKKQTLSHQQSSPKNYHSYQSNNIHHQLSKNNTQDQTNKQENKLFNIYSKFNRSNTFQSENSNKLNYLNYRYQYKDSSKDEFISRNYHKQNLNQNQVSTILDLYQKKQHQEINSSLQKPNNFYKINPLHQKINFNMS